MAGEELFLGPLGALVGATIATAALWKQHREDDKTRIAANMEVVANKNVDIEYERRRTREAEERLEKAVRTLTKAADTMERSVAVTEKLVEIAGRAQDRLDRMDRGK